MVGRKLAIACAALSLLICVPARAERSIAVSGIFRALGARVADPQMQRHERDESLASLPRSSAFSSRPSNGASSRVRQAVGTLVFTRDLEVPGLSHVIGVRLVPLKQALGGESGFPLVLRARVGSKRCGLEIGGRF